MPRLYPRISFGVGGSDLVSVHTSEAASPLDLANFGAKIDQIASPPESNWQRTYRKQADSSSSFVMYMPDHLAFMVEISSAYQDSETTQAGSFTSCHFAGIPSPTVSTVSPSWFRNEECTAP